MQTMSVFDAWSYHKFKGQDGRGIVLLNNLNGEKSKNLKNDF